MDMNSIGLGKIKLCFSWITYPHAYHIPSDREDVSIRSHMYLYVFFHSKGLQGFPCICVHIDRLHIWPLDLLQKYIFGP